MVRTRRQARRGGHQPLALVQQGNAGLPLAAPPVRGRAGRGVRRPQGGRGALGQVLNLQGGQGNGPLFPPPPPPQDLQPLLVQLQAQVMQLQREQQDLLRATVPAVPNLPPGQPQGTAATAPAGQPSTSGTSQVSGTAAPAGTAPGMGQLLNRRLEGPNNQGNNQGRCKVQRGRLGVVMM